MYNLSMRNTAINEPIGFFVSSNNNGPETQYNSSAGDQFNMVSNQNSKSQQLFQTSKEHKEGLAPINSLP